jgi:hypothetical protein
MLLAPLFQVALAVACTTASGPAQLSVTASGTYRWTPAAAGEQLRCSSEGFEPLDVQGGDDIKPVDIIFTHSRPVLMHGARGIARVQWWRPGEEVIDRLAERSVDATGDIAVAVGRAPRIVTFIWSDGRRLSTFVPESTDELSIGPPLTGSELIAWVGSRRVRPAKLIAHSDARTRSAEFDTHGFAAISGLPPGRYAVAVLYQSGINTPLQDAAVVRTNDTARLANRNVPAAGALVVRLDRDSCRDVIPREAVVATIASRSKAVQRVNIGSETCDATIDGLTPADYTVQTAAAAWPPSEPTGPISVANDRFAELEVSVEYASVSGTAFLGSAGARKLLLHFQGRAGDTSTSTDEEGHFSVTMKPGDYDVDLRSTPYVPGDIRQVTFKRGHQDVDLKFVGGRVTVYARADGEAFSKPVEVHLNGQANYGITGVALPPDYKADFLGIPNGTYSVGAESPPNWTTTETTSVTIDPVTTEKEIEVRLQRRHDRHVIVRTIEGAPVAGARVFGGPAVLEEGEPGHFEMPIFAGNRLRISRSGYLPVCRDLHESEENIEVILSTGPFSATLNIARTSPDAVGTLLGTPGSTCAVYVGDLSHSVTPTSEGVQLQIHGLTSGRFIYIVPDGRQVAFNVPGDPTVVP